MTDGRHIENYFMAIARLHIVRLRRNLEFGSLIARNAYEGLVMKMLNFEKSNMVDGRHIENRYMPIPQPRIVRT